MISINELKYDPSKTGWVVRRTSLIIGYGSIPWGFQSSSYACLSPQIMKWTYSNKYGGTE